MTNPIETLLAEIANVRFDGAAKGYLAARLVSVNSQPILNPQGLRYFVLGHSKLGEDPLLDREETQ